MPAIGARVRFTRTDKPERTITGTVTEHYPGYRFHAAGKPVDVPDAVAVRVDEIPEWWAYPDTDVFAPGIDEIEPLTN
jgi:hypothetical protein